MEKIEKVKVLPLCRHVADCATSTIYFRSLPMRQPIQAAIIVQDI